MRTECTDPVEARERASEEVRVFGEIIGECFKTIPIEMLKRNFGFILSHSNFALNLQQHSSGLSNTDLHQKPKQNNGNLTVDFSANSRMSGHPETNHIEVTERGLKPFVS